MPVESFGNKLLGNHETEKPLLVRSSGGFFVVLCLAAMSKRTQYVRWQFQEIAKIPGKVMHCGTKKVGAYGFVRDLFTITYRHHHLVGHQTANSYLEEHAP